MKKKLAVKKTGVAVVRSAGIGVLNDIRQLIESARGRVAQNVNAELTMLYWKVGNRVRREILKERRAEYGQEILLTLSAKLVPDYGEGFKERNLARMIKFSEYFSKEEIVVTLSLQLSWSHFVEIIPVKDDLAREFYAEMCRMEHWSVRTLRKKIGSMMFERTAIAKKADTVIKMEIESLRKEDKLTPDLVFRDPYFLDFLGLKGTFQEKDLEASILRDMESFILELGVGFSFIARQKRIIVGGDDFYLDLLFYHRDLRRLVAIELKMERFKPDFKGQMELYLKWLDKYDRKLGEDPPIGLILCAGKSNEQIELLELSKSGIRVAEYMTELMPKDLLEKKFHDAIKLARLRLDHKGRER